MNFSIVQQDDINVNMAIDVRSVRVRQDTKKSIYFNTSIKFNPCQDMDINVSHCISIIKEFQFDHWFSTEAEAVLISAYCTAILAGIIGNAIVCYVGLNCKHLQKPRNILVINLSVCGLIMSLVCMPFSLTQLILINWHLGEFVCRLSPTLQTTDVFASTFTIVAIAIDRFTSAVRTSRDESTRKVIYYSVVLIWCLSIVLCVPMFLFHEIHHVNPESVQVQLYVICMEIWPSGILKKAYTTSILIIQYIVPVIIIFLLHGKICQFLQIRININPRTEHEITRGLKEIKRQRRNTFVLIAIVALFAVAWLPLTVLNTLADYDWKLFLNTNFHHRYAYCLLIAMCTACLNPVIYGWFNTGFKKAIIQLICGIRKQSRDPTEIATIKNDSKGNSHPPFQFYNSLELD